MMVTTPGSAALARYENDNGTRAGPPPTARGDGSGSGAAASGLGADGGAGGGTTVAPGGSSGGAPPAPEPRVSDRGSQAAQATVIATRRSIRRFTCLWILRRNEASGRRAPDQGA